MLLSWVGFGPDYTSYTKLKSYTLLRDETIQKNILLGETKYEVGSRFSTIFQKYLEKY